MHFHKSTHKLVAILHHLNFKDQKKNTVRLQLYLDCGRGLVRVTVYTQPRGQAVCIDLKYTGSHSDQNNIFGNCEN